MNQQPQEHRGDKKDYKNSETDKRSVRAETMKTRVLRLVQKQGILAPAFVSTVALALIMGSAPHMIVQKVCSPQSLPDINLFICNDSERVTQATAITAAGSTIKSVTTAVSVALAGSWRDATGRNKPLLIVGELTQALCALVFLTASWHWGSSPWTAVVVEAALGGALGAGIRGLAASCIVIENSEPEERTIKLQTFSTVAFIAALVSSVLRGTLLTSLGYSWFFAIVAGLHLLATVMFASFVHDTKRTTTKKDSIGTIEKLKTAFKPRENFWVVWLMTICKALVSAYFSAEMILRLYFLQQRFQLTVNETSILGTYTLLILVAGSFGMPLLFTKVLKWSDFRIGITSSSLTALSALASAFASTKTHLYIIALLDILKYLLYSVPSSILSKCVRSDELGLFSGFSSVFGVFLPFGVNYMYKATFAATSKTMPGAYYLLSFIANLIIIGLFCASAYMYKAPGKNGSEEQDDKKLN